MTEASVGYVTSGDGTRIGYERSGEGPPLVLIHGTTADRTRWAPILPALARHFTVYAIDRRGRGLSGDTEPYSLEREFEDVAAVVESIPGPVNLLGHSYGALCALEGALRVKNLRRLVLYEPVARVDEEIYQEGLKERLEAHLARGEREEALVAFLREAAGVPDEDLAMMRATPAWAARVAAAHTLPREFADGDHEIDPARLAPLRDVPVLLLAGGDSPPLFRAVTDIIHAALPNSRVEVMAGQTHIAINTAPDLFARLVIDFLSA
jgi:pimeloyl-ACP methyl ester carboxylesterase